MKMSKEQVEKDFLDYKARKKDLVINDSEIKLANFRKATRPVQRAALLAQRKIKGQTVDVYGNKDYKIPKGRSVTFVVSHIGKFDYEIVNEQIKEQFYVMASDYRNMHGNMNETMMEWFGVWYVDELSKEDRFYTGEVNKKTLNDGYHTMILSEGTWNISENEIIYDTHFGAVDGAMSTNSLILPISVEQYGNHFVVNFGEFFDPTIMAKEISFSLGSYKNYNELDENDELENDLKLLIKTETNTVMRDMLATLKWEIWEKKGVEKRSTIPINYWDEFIKDRVAEWPGYSMQEQIDSVVHTKEKKLHEEILRDLEEFYELDPSFFFASTNRFNNYLEVKKHIDEIVESLKEYRSSLPEDKPMSQKLTEYKELKRNIGK